MTKKISFAVTLSSDELKSIMKKNHVNDSDYLEFMKIYTSVFSKTLVTFHYCFSEEQNKELVMLNKESIIVIATLGKALDEIQNQYVAEGKLTQAMYMEYLSWEYLSKAYSLFRSLFQKRESLFLSVFQFLDNEYTKEEKKHLFSFVKQQDVLYNDSCVMEPKKSVFFISEYSKRQNCNSLESLSECANCKNKTCEYHKK